MKQARNSSGSSVQAGVQGVRRKLLQAAGAMGGLAVAGLSGCAVGTTNQGVATPVNSRGNAMFAYVGSRTTRERNARGDGISVYKVDLTNGNLELVQLVKDLVNPSFLTLSRDGQYLYTVHGDLSDISAFKVDRATGKLTFINRKSTHGKNPVHLAIDPTGKYVVVSNHLGSSLAVLPIAADGSLQEMSQLVTLEGPIGPHRVEQKLSKPHFNPFDPSGRFVIVPDKGLDRTFSFQFADGKLVPAVKPFVVARETSGPRHIVFHHRLPTAYVVNELDSTVTTYAYSTADGSLEPRQILSTLPETFTGNSRASEIEIDRSGQFLFASNRGYDSIAGFFIDPQTGLLRAGAVTQSAGKTPRFFTITPDNRYLYALNEDSDTIVAFTLDQRTAALKPTGFSVASGSPVCMIFS
ncbi:hemagglutinin [Herbaspirillum sp. BH-1]|uniref:6-phosphogluconolactonase (Cycloisomerase 2 family) n=1 Tax=Herbaspirillum frisingense TaxID=92645 RepID=A0ABU1PEE6_9BURK|nr:6-phosphogluconolactonase (cycloisomerase 2 family) [Herbaspirillum frisingense]PLY59534.1 hemagglutinin [Herbaspirillum sp. BH-1]